MSAPFVGIGHNPEGKDLPLGFGMQLAQIPEAMDTYGRMSQPQKDAVIGYIQRCETSEDAEQRINTVVNGLKNGQTSF